MQGGHADRLARALLPALAMVDQTVVGLGLQLRLQGRPGFGAAKGAARARPVGFGPQALARAALGQPTFEGGYRHGKEPRDFGLQQAAVDGGHGPFAQVHRIRLGHRPPKHSSTNSQVGISDVRAFKVSSGAGLSGY
jgi:hypothetical protein